MSFLFSPLLWGLCAVGIPVLIHLINLRRHKKIQWAAMDFLLQSQKKNKKWIIFKQLLLLLMRMAAIALIVLMVAQPILKSAWSGMFGQASTHHFVLLDDSFSMSDRSNNEIAFDMAKKVAQRIGEQAANEGGTHYYTLLKYSDALKLSAGSQPELFRQRVDGSFGKTLETRLGPMRVSESDAGPIKAIEAMQRIITEDGSETIHVYLVTDFRKNQWGSMDEIRVKLQEAEAEGKKINLVDCVSSDHENLAITSFMPSDGVRAVGAGFFMDVKVKNFGLTPASGVTLQLSEDGASLPGQELPTIKPGEEITYHYRANFLTAGSHFLEASLVSDAIELDNKRYFAADIPVGIPILVINASGSGTDAKMISFALDPGGRSKTGWQPRIEAPSFLRNPENLKKFAGVFLLDVPKLDPSEVAALEDFVKQGGGVACYLGSESDAPHVNNKWYREGEGFFPVPLRRATQLLTDEDEVLPDISLTEHPIFNDILESGITEFNTAVVNYYFAIADGWIPSNDKSVRVIATLRNNAPIILEKEYGKGKVFTILSKASQEKTQIGFWNNFSSNGAFIVIANEIAVQITSRWVEVVDRMVNEPIEIQASEELYNYDMAMDFPVLEGRDVSRFDAIPKDGVLVSKFDQTQMSGKYSLELNLSKGGTETKLYSVNVPAAEGNLIRVTNQEISDGLQGLQYRLYKAEDFTRGANLQEGTMVSDTLLYILLVLLVGEQFLAYLLSFHSKVPATSK